MDDVDVIVVGAGIAGCTAAIGYGRAGLRVVLLDKHRDADTYKVLCGHFIQGGTEDVLRRTGLWEALVDAGAVPQQLARWTRAGWGVPPPGAALPLAISLRRERLDPLLRRLAAGTPGVALRLGQTVTSLVQRGGRVVGVRTPDGEYRARLVVGADGYRSKVAELSGARADWAPNARFGYWAYYHGIRPRDPAEPGLARLWQLDPDVGILVHTDSGLSLLAAFPTKARLAAFRSDPGAALEEFTARLPDAPDLSDAQRESKVIGTTDYPCVRRDPLPTPGVVLVGDAAITSDPTPAPGCGWAFRAADWLVAATAPALRDDTELWPGGPGRQRPGTALRRYQRDLNFILAHDRAIRRDARGRPASLAARAVNRASLHDPELAYRAALFASRTAPASDLLNPRTLVRAYRVLARLALARGSS